MKIITREGLAKATAKLWRIQYREAVGDELKVANALDRLSDPDPDEVDRIIGNDSWTRVPHCDECWAENQPVIIRVGELPGYDSATAHLCEVCLRKAMSLIESETRYGT